MSSPHHENDSEAEREEVQLPPAAGDPEPSSAAAAAPSHLHRVQQRAPRAAAIAFVQPEPILVASTHTAYPQPKRNGAFMDRVEVKAATASLTQNLAALPHRKLTFAKVAGTMRTYSVKCTIPKLFLIVEYCRIII
jgi:hypothetical protein